MRIAIQGQDVKSRFQCLILLQLTVALVSAVFRLCFVLIPALIIPILSVYYRIYSNKRPGGAANHEP